MRSSCGRSGRATRREPAAVHRDVVRRHERGRGRHRRGDGAAAVTAPAVIRSSIVSSQHEFHAVFGGVVPEVASRRHTELLVGAVADALDEAGVDLGRPRRRRRDDRSGPDRRAARGPGRRQGPRLCAPPAAHAGRPPAGPPRGRLRARRRGAVRLPHGQRRPHAARRWSSAASSSAWSGARSTTPPARPSTRAPVCSACRIRAVASSTCWRLRGDPARVAFPRSLPRGFDFSFSGLKTALLYYLREHADEAGSEARRASLAASYQEAIVDQLVGKTVRCAERRGPAPGRGRRRRGRELAAAPPPHRGLRAARPRGLRPAGRAVHRQRRHGRPGGAPPRGRPLARLPRSRRLCGRTRAERCCAAAR